MKLYDDPRSGNGYKVRLLLSHLSQPYQYVPIDILRGESRTTEFLQKNLNGRIPVLELDNGSSLPESNAILYFLAQGTDYWPTQPFEQAQVMQWLFFEQYSHEPNIATPRFWLTIKGLDDTPFNRQLLAQKQEAGNQALAVMNEHLQTRRFFVADRYSIADIALYAYTHEAHEGGFDLSRYPAVVAWLERVSAQPGHVTMDQWNDV
ncbi:glutathione S-transferase family protein [Marinimicrobium sp. ABcell2]|uniref:glutathione S-transferase family protein n=1 Tax=Marinimicrobium sp. ABcell2 TaxID=3069751 RepID=UPI0027B74F3F|nr:glutathione S-transferase family protein [Marinimicrobium sp. ABcell2]MDQ2078415.1 glutathione S-transferase family protein [Marinimicrobium sp. ABcell2]